MKDLASVYLTRIRNHRWIAVLIVVGTIVGGVATFTNTITTALTTLRRWIHPYDTPRIVQFAIDLNHSEFYETFERKMAASEDSIKTFLISPLFEGLDHITGKAIFQVSIENPNDQDLVITDVAYHILDTGEVLGGAPGPLKPQYTYSHELRLEPGIQRHQLVPPFSIPSHSAGAFDLQLYTNNPRAGLCWIMNVEFLTTVGSVSTDNFQLILSGPFVY